MRNVNTVKIVKPKPAIILSTLRYPKVGFHDISSMIDQGLLENSDAIYTKSRRVVFYVENKCINRHSIDLELASNDICAN